jgi:hypothetical protein
MKTLQQYEKNERILATKLFSLIPTIKAYEFTEGRICYDTIIHLENGNTILGEIKVRNCEFETYPDYILEVMKFKSLCKRMKDNNYNLLYYINFFNNEKEELKDFVVFNLSARIKEWQVTLPTIQHKWMNEVTFKSNHKVQKEVLMLKYDKNKDWFGTIN